MRTEGADGRKHRVWGKMKLNEMQEIKNYKINIILNTRLSKFILNANIICT